MKKIKMEVEAGGPVYIMDMDKIPIVNMFNIPSSSLQVISPYDENFPNKFRYLLSDGRNILLRVKKSVFRKYRSYFNDINVLALDTDNFKFYLGRDPLFGVNRLAFSKVDGAMIALFTMGVCVKPKGREN